MREGKQLPLAIREGEQLPLAIRQRWLLIEAQGLQAHAALQQGKEMTVTMIIEVAKHRKKRIYFLRPEKGNRIDLTQIHIDSDQDNVTVPYISFTSGSNALHLDLVPSNSCSTQNMTLLYYTCKFQ
jgi:hypothetical protein